MACLVVWDLKTIPDNSGLAAVNDRPNGRDEDAHNADGPVDRSIHRSIICISRLVAYFDV